MDDLISFKIHPVDQVVFHFVEDAEEEGIDEDHRPGWENTYPPQVAIDRHQAAAEKENEHTPEILVF